MIEYRRAGGGDGELGWRQANAARPIKFTRFPVSGLEAGASYEFRVRAVDLEGRRTSRFSPISAPFSATDSLGKSFLLLLDMSLSAFPFLRLK